MEKSEPDIEDVPEALRYLVHEFDIWPVLEAIKLVGVAPASVDNFLYADRRRRQENLLK